MEQIAAAAAKRTRHRAKTAPVERAAFGMAVACVAVVLLTGAVAASPAGPGTTPPPADPVGTAVGAENETERPNETDASRIRAITADRLVDRGPALAATDDGYVVVWERLMGDNQVKDGRDVFWAEYAGGEWSRPEPITNDQKFDDHIDVAYDPGSDRLVAVWTKITESLDESETPRDIFKYANRSEVVYAVYEGGSWSEPTRLTDNDIHDGAPKVVASDGTFHVVWQRGIGAGPKTLKHTTLEAGAGGIEATRIGSAVYEASSSTGGGLRIAYLDPEQKRGRNGSVVVLSGSDGLRKAAEYEVTRLASLEVGPDELVWRQRTGNNSRNAVYHARGGTVRQIEFADRIRGVNELRLASTGDGSALVYRAYYERNVTYRFFYKLWQGDGWSFDQALNQTARPKFSFDGIQAAGTSGDVGIVFRASLASNPEQNADLFSVVQEFRPDLAVDATSPQSPANTSVGDDATVQYTVQNRGDADLEGEFEVTLVAGSEVVARRTYDGLRVGERLQDAFEERVPSSGQLSVRVDPADTVQERDEGNNEASVTFASHDVAVTRTDSTRDGSTVTLTVTVSNLGPVRSERVEVILRSRNNSESVETLDGLDPGENRTIRVEVGVERLARENSLSVLAKSDGDGNRLNNVGSFQALQPEVGIVGSEVRFERVGDQVVADVLVDNQGPGRATFPLVIQYPDGEVIAVRNVSVEGATTASKLVTKRVRVDLPDSTLGQRIEVLADVEADAENRDNVFSVEVPVRPRDDTPPAIETFDVTASGSGIRVEVVASETLDRSTFQVGVSGPETVTLTGEDFEATEGNRYVATYETNASGTYTVELERVTDGSGNAVESTKSATVRIGSQESTTSSGGIPLVPVVLALAVVAVAVAVVYRRRG